jgi:hypothetical protein
LNRWLSLLTGERGEEEVGEEPIDIQRRESLVLYKSFNTLCTRTTCRCGSFGDM